MAVVFLIVGVVLIATWVGLAAMVYIWMERKVSGRIQDRLGPTRVGGRFGWLQSIADGVKLIQKEDLMPADADRPLFRLSPYIVMIGAFTAFVALPFSKDWVALNISVGLFLMLALMSVEVFGVILAGYASGSKWSLLGAMREAAQVVSYEVPMGICVIIPIMITGTLNLNTIGMQQSGFFWNWYLFHSPPLFLAAFAYFTCATASCKRAPFDLAEAESELVAGFLTEFSGMRWSFFFLAEYAAMFVVSGIFVVLFLGGWNGPIPIFSAIGLEDSIIGKLFGLGNFLIKATLMVFLMMWVRWTLPRLRIDQVMTTCLKYLLPISCGLLLSAALWEVYVRDYVPVISGGGYPVDVSQAGAPALDAQ